MRLASIGILALALVPSPAGGSPQEAAPANDREFDARIRPILSTYCFSCHGPRKQKAKINLSLARGEADLARDPETWLAALRQLKTRAMPPEDADKQITPTEREKVVAWLEAAFERIDERAPRDPGRVTLRRLNRVEYDNTIRDLVGLDLRLSEDFPLDDVSEGFDNLADVLTLPPLLLEKYVDAADRVLDKAVVADGPVALLETRIEAESLSKEKTGAAVNMRFEHELAALLAAPADGRYEVRVRAWQERGTDGRAILALKVDGVDMALVAVEGPGTYSASLDLQAGDRRLALRHTPPRAYKKEEAVPDTRLHLDWIEVRGPERSLSHRRLFGPPGPETREAARTILERFGSRAFRRPMTPAELDRHLRLYDAARAARKSFAAAVRQGLWSLLVSPHFLYRVETDTSDRDPSGHCRLNGWELASRLSYFLWSTMPDDELFDLAARGQLRDPEVLRRQARRMLAHPKARALTDNFAGQWLGLRKLEQVQPDRELFPSFGEGLRRAMHDEAWLFFANLVREDRSILELVDADYTFLNEPLARHYGIPGVQGDALRRVALRDRSRGGVVTMAAVLTLTSHPTRTSAVKRGKWILDEVLGAPPPPPPPNVPELEEATRKRPDAATLTLRQRMELHRSDPACTNCHKRMDVLGLGLENFDPVGRWREKDGGRKIDASGTLPSGESFSGPAELKKILAASRDDFARALAEKMFVYALGRPAGRADRREIKRAVEETRKSGYRFSALVESVVTSYPFRHRRPAEKEEAR